MRLYLALYSIRERVIRKVTDDDFKLIIILLSPRFHLLCNIIKVSSDSKEGQSLHPNRILLS